MDNTAIVYRIMRDNKDQDFSNLLTPNETLLKHLTDEEISFIETNID